MSRRAERRRLAALRTGLLFADADWRKWIQAQIDELEPVRAKMSAARKAAWARRHPELAALLSEQRVTYRMLRRKGCAHDEALREAQTPRRGAA